MGFRKLTLRVGIPAIFLIGLVVPARVGASTVPSLIISQLKVTSSAGQFVTLYNQSNSAIDLSQYEIDYLNSSNKVSSLPATGQVAAHGFYMLSDDQVRLCYQMTVNAVSLGFSTTSGSLQVWQISADKTSKQLQDSVAWASKATSGAVTLPAQNDSSSVSLLRQPTDSLGAPAVNAVGAGSWQAVAPDTSNPCNLDIVNTTTNISSPSANPGNQLGLGQAPPATIIFIASDGSGTDSPHLPAGDVGLAAPQLTELLPNPNGTGTDGTDEFIELYNSNDAVFDLSGFILQTGSTTKHNYTFADGTTLPAKSFKAFYSSDTGLSLSNTSGQAALLDPYGNSLSGSDVYGTAKDGQSWALANGKWYWTSKPTPGSANVINQVVTASKKTSKSSSSSRTGSSAVKGAATSGSSSLASGTDASTPAPVHPLVLVAIAVLAVGYGVYEYRHDIANFFYQRRRNRAIRRAARASAEGR